MHGLAVGEDAGELVAGHARPVADAAGIHVHEGRAGGRIEADAAALHAQPGDTQIRKLGAGDVEIDGLAQHVLAETGDAAAALAQHRVGLRRAIGGDDGDRLLGADFAVNLPQQIEQLRVHARGFVAPPVAQQPVDLFECLRVVAAFALEGDGEHLAGMHMVERELARVAVGDRVLELAGGCESEDSCEARHNERTNESVAEDMSSGADYRHEPVPWRVELGEPVRPPLAAIRLNVLLPGGVND